MKELIIISKNIYENNQPKKKEGYLVIDQEQGKIKDIVWGKDIPKNICTIDFSNYHVVTGLIDCHTHLGLIENGHGEMGNDLNETTQPILPQIRALDGVDYLDPYFQIALSEGITAVGILPGPANIVAGQGCAIYTGHGNLHSRIIKENIGIKCAFGEIPQKYSQKNTTNIFPKTKMGMISLLRQKIDTAKKTINSKQKIEHIDLETEAWQMVLSKEIPLRIHVYRNYEIDSAISISKEYNINIVLEHAPDAIKKTEAIKKNKIPITCNPYFIFPSRREQLSNSPYQPKILADAGITVALSSNHPEIAINYLQTIAGLSCRYGLTEKQSLDCVTLNPAKILGIDKFTGSLSIGKNADIACWNGSPLDWKSKPVCVFIKGKIVYQEGNKYAVN